MLMIFYLFHNYWTLVSLVNFGLSCDGKIVRQAASNLYNIHCDSFIYLCSLSLQRIRHGEGGDPHLLDHVWRHGVQVVNLLQVAEGEPRVQPTHGEDKVHHVGGEQGVDLGEGKDRNIGEKADRLAGVLDGELLAAVVVWNNELLTILFVRLVRAVGDKVAQAVDGDAGAIPAGEVRPPVLQNAVGQTQPPRLPLV